ncbi:acyltransferase family protein [Magnetococcus marinus]|uniref:acyltransferase family protein n=1 Tax=Magnetococcus marinus TaxID=1124597 RepID=UPI0005A297DC|nr:acyltransferase [Magnetococcus marinus]
MSLPDSTSKHHLHAVHALRGVAALSVAWFHFTHGNEIFAAYGGWLVALGNHGWAGVEIFFVISGFIVPLSMHRAGYHWRHLWAFIGKRLARVEPPYLLSIVSILILNSLSSMHPAFKGSPFVLDWAQITPHFLYLVEIMDKVWLNPVYWSLAIEFQYYLYIMITLPFIQGRGLGLWVTLLLPLVLSYWGGHFLPQYWHFFLFGLLAFRRYSGLASTVENRWFVVPLTIYCYSASGIALTILALSSWIIVQLPFPRINWLAFLGTISYSLYLLHVPIGGRVINIAIRFVDSVWEQWLAVFIATAASIMASYVFFRVVEYPSQLLAAKIRYR